MKKVFCIILTLWFCNIACTQQIQNNKTKDEIIFDEYVNNIKDKKTNDDLFFYTALYFLNTPYGSSALKINEKEYLVVNLREFDCVSYVENAIALYRTVLSDSISFEHFKSELRNIRYRGGIIDGYTSRLHYTTDWIFDNEIKKYVFDKTASIGGIEFPVKLYFISRNYENKDYLKKHSEDVEKLKAIEEIINSRKHYYIPKGQIPTIEKNINTGDILCFTTKTSGLDVNHMGIAVWQDGVLTFIHASSKYKKVIINPEPLFNYCNNNKNITGIIVVKVVKPE